MATKKDVKAAKPAVNAKTSPAVKVAVKPAPAPAKIKPVTKKPPAPKPISKKVLPVKAAAKSAQNVPRSRGQTGDKTAVFIDLDNTGANITNLLEIISILKNSGTIIYGKLYGYTDDRAAQFEEAVRENRFETAGKQRLKTGSAHTIDLRLVMDAIEVTEKNNFDTVFVWMGPGDLMPLFGRLKESGVKILTVEVPEVDYKNKLVDQAVKLYSAASVGTTPTYSAPVQAAYVPPPPVYTPPPPAAADPVIDVGAAVIAEAPLLPRRKGAPEFGAKSDEVAPDPENVPMTEDEEREYLLELAAQTFAEFRQERAQEKEMREMTSVKPPENDDDFGVKSVAAHAHVPEPVPAVEPAPEEMFDVKPMPEEITAPEPVSEEQGIGPDPWMLPENPPGSEEEEKEPEREPIPEPEPDDKFKFDSVATVSDAASKPVPDDTEAPEAPDATFTDFGDFGSLNIPR